MERKSEHSGTGVGFSGALTLLFVALKLTNHIDWSLWWVLSPAWINAILILLLVSVALLELKR